MKRSFALILAALFLLSGCGPEEAETEPAPSEEISIVADENAAFTVTAASAGEDGGLCITARCENRSDTDLVFAWENVSVNDYMIDPQWAAEIPAGKKSIEKISFSAAELEECGIRAAEEIFFSLSIFSADDTVVSGGYTLLLEDGVPRSVRYENTVETEEPTEEAVPEEPEATQAPLSHDGPGDRIYAGGDKIVWLHSDGTVTGAGFVDGHLQEMRTWYDITDVAVASSHAMGLRADGTVAQVGGGSQLDSGNLSDVTHIAAGKNHTVAVHGNGSCTLMGYSSRLVMSCFYDLEYITQVSIGSAHSAAVNRDGRWFVAGSAAYGKENLSWHLPVEKLICGGDHTVALNDNGSVVATGANNYGQCETQGWKNIVDVAAGALHTVGLRSDGTVVAVGHNSYGQCDVNGWSNIVAIACGDYMTVGVQADGRVLVAYADAKTDDAGEIARSWHLENPERSPGLDF